MTARRAASLAMAAGGLAVVAALASAGAGEPEDGSAGDWLLGLVLLLGPFLCAAIVLSVVASTLLRPVGSVAAVPAALAALVHVGVAVDDRGTGAGLAVGSAAVASVVLLVVAVAAGPDGRPDERSPDGEDEGPPPVEVIDGPPLDVVTPLHDARAHAAKAAVAWLVVLVVTVVTTPVLLGALGWPRVERRLDTRVVAVTPSGDRTAVTFEAADGTRTRRWTDVVEDSRWEVGDRTVRFVDDEGRINTDQQFGLAGVPLLMPVLLVGTAVWFSSRRYWGLVVACWDATHGDDRPRLGYVTVVHTRRTLRPLVAVWERDPTPASPLPTPDAAYRADYGTGSDLETHPPPVVVHRAWVDTGAWRRSKPRWIGTDAGVLVPHRRALLGRWFLRMLTRRADVEPLVDLRHGPPPVGAESVAVTGQPPRHDLRSMVGWRLLAVVGGVAAAFLAGHGGEHVRFEAAAEGVAGPRPGGVAQLDR